MTVFPFSAIVGQDSLRRALLLGVIQPKLGGVLVRGVKGAAKTTAVRALAELLPVIETVAGCPCQRQPGEDVPAWPLPADAPTIQRQTPLVELPLGATEDRVLGALHLEKALRGQRAFDPGLLAAANRGILYIDEVNLLPDQLVDVLLDAAASGVHRLEREGLSLTHPARFLLIGTMNPEEGDLRPQLLDRFGLAVAVGDLSEVTERAEAVRRRMAFELDAAAFRQHWTSQETALTERIVRARALLPQVRISADLVKTVSERCLNAGVEGLRADLTICQAAAAWAAFEGRSEVEPGDIEAVAELALAHRRKPPQPPRPQGRWPREAEPPNGPRQTENGMDGPGAANQSAPRTERPPIRDEIAGSFETRLQPALPRNTRSTFSNRSRAGTAPQRGRIGGETVWTSSEFHSLAWADTLRAAALDQRERGRMQDTNPLILRADDLRFRPRCQPASRLLLFVVDASGSMAAWRRMRETKAAILALLVQAYRQRDRIALLTFGGTGSRLVLSPTRGLAAPRRALEKLAVGGATPLAHGLSAACQFLVGQQRRMQHLPIWTVLLSDGRANVPLHSDDPWADALHAAQRLATVSTATTVVDTETGWPRLGRAAELARAVRGDCVSLEAVPGRAVPARWEAAS